MEFNYTYSLPYPRQRVWESLLDFDLLSRVIPGVERLERLGDDKCNMVVKVGVPLVTGSYRGTVAILEKNPFDSYRLVGEATGRLGWVKGEAAFQLHDKDVDTQVLAKLRFQVGGLLAGVGQRLMEGIAKGMAREFFAAFEREIRSKTNV